MPYNRFNLYPVADLAGDESIRRAGASAPNHKARLVHSHAQRLQKYSTRGFALVLAAVFLSAVVLRVWQLGQLPGLNGDEAWYGNQAMQWLAGKPVAWFTPTGNPINLFFVGPLVGLHALIPPSSGLLRSLSAACGLLALLLNFVLCRRLINRQTAIVSTLLLAISPVAIAYSRFAWDASQTPLAAVLVVYAALAVQKSGFGRWRRANLGVQQESISPLPAAGRGSIFFMDCRNRRFGAGDLYSPNQPLSTAFCGGMLLAKVTMVASGAAIGDFNCRGGSGRAAGHLRI